MCFLGNGPRFMILTRAPFPCMRFPKPDRERNHGFPPFPQVIHELSRSKNEARSHAWLRDYFVIHGEGFTKDYDRNVGRNFLKKLLSAPPVVVVEGADADGEGGDIAMIDPVDMAARICAQRQCVADKWVDALGEVEDDHLAMKRAHMQDCFDMQITGQLNAPDSSS